MQHLDVKHSILDQITHDHNQAKLFFSEYEKYRERANFEEANKWYHQWSWEIARHSIAEELIVYPALKNKMPVERVDGNLSEHQEVKENLSKLEKLSIETEEFHRIMIATQNSLVEHMKKEEEEQLPEFERLSTHEEIEAIVKKFERRKAIVPTRSHPNAPINPYLESLVGLLAAPLDKLKDMFSDFPSQGEVEKVAKDAGCPHFQNAPSTH